MATGNRMLVCIIAILAAAFGAAAFALAWAGKQGGAVFVGLATTCLGILCPSPIKHDQGGAVVTGDARTVNVNTEETP